MRWRCTEASNPALACDAAFAFRLTMAASSCFAAGVSASAATSGLDLRNDWAFTNACWVLRCSFRIHVLLYGGWTRGEERGRHRASWLPASRELGVVQLSTIVSGRAGTGTRVAGIVRRRAGIVSRRAGVVSRRAGVVSRVAGGVDGFAGAATAFTGVAADFTSVVTDFTGVVSAFTGI